MESDIQFNVLPKGIPDLAKVLLGIDSDLPYQLKSEAFKDLKFTADGVFDCEQAAVAYIVEFQAVRESGSRTVYHRRVIERNLYHINHPHKHVRLVILYLSRKLDSGGQPRRGYADDSDDPFFQVLYLDEIIRQLKEQQPTPQFWSLLHYWKRTTPNSNNTSPNTSANSNRSARTSTIVTRF